MNDYSRMSRSGDFTDVQALNAPTAQQRVLRNTYGLLALSMVPTVLGAWVGLVSPIHAWMMASPGVSALIFLAGAIAFMVGIERTRDSGMGVGLLLAFTFFMGMMLSRLLGFVLGMSNGSNLIMFAFGGTACVFGIMSTLAHTIKRDLTGLGKWLFVGVLIMLVAGIANIFLQLPALMLALSVLAIGVFSAFMLYDIQRVVRGGETNYVSATLAIYLDLYNIFSNLLALLGIFGGSRD